MAETSDVPSVAGTGRVTATSARVLRKLGAKVIRVRGAKGRGRRK